MNSGRWLAAVLLAALVTVGLPATAMATAQHCFPRSFAVGNKPPVGPHNHLDVLGLTCMDAYYSMTTYFDSDAANSAWREQPVVFVGRTPDGIWAWRCTITEYQGDDIPARYRGASLHLACHSNHAMMVFDWWLPPEKSCPPFWASGESWVGGEVTRNATCVELHSFTDDFSTVTGDQFSSFPPHQEEHAMVTWPSFLREGGTLLPMRFHCAYRTRGTFVIGGWKCGDEIVGFNFQYKEA